MEKGASRVGALVAVVLAAGVGLLLYLASHVDRAGRRTGGTGGTESELEHAASPAGFERTGPPALSPPLEERIDGKAEIVPVATEPGRPPRPEMRVVVHDAVDMRPITGARVTLLDRATPVPKTTGGDGACTLPLLSLVDPVRMRVEAAGHFHSDQELVPVPNVAVELLRSTVLTGRVLAADTGRPVADATLGLVHAECRSCGPQRVISAADGSYELAGVPVRSEVLIEVEAEGYAHARRLIELRGDEPVMRRDIRIERGLEIAGRVEDWTSGRALEGARVGELTTDDRGQFRGRIQAGPATGRTTIEVRAGGYATLEVALALPLHPESLEVPSGEHVFRLPRLAYVEGRVMDLAGRALAGVAVGHSCVGPITARPGEARSPLDAVPAGWTYSSDARPQPSDAEGRYRTPVLPWSENCTFSVETPGYLHQSLLLPSIGEPGSRRPLDWSLVPGAEPTVLSGLVTINGQANDALGGTIAWSGPTLSGSIRFRDGHYRVEVEPGEVQVAVSSALSIPLSSEVVVHVRAGEKRTVDLDSAAPTATISGSVRFDDGAPVAGNAVHASSLFSSGRAWTDERGKYELHVTDLGQPFVVSTTGFAPGSRGNEQTSDGVFAGRHDVDFVLRRGYRFFLRAREADTGAALKAQRDVQLLARSQTYRVFSELEPESLLPDAEGWYAHRTSYRELDLLALPRAQELPLYGASQQRGIALDGPAPAHVELVLERGVDVALELAEGVAPWPAEHELLLLEEELWTTAYGPSKERSWTSPFDELHARCTVRFDEHGRALLRGLAPGNYRFKPLPADLRLDPEFVRVERGALPVRLRWSGLESR